MQLLLAEIISDLQHVSPSHKLLILDNQPLKVKGDKERIGQVITNLVTNAVKYSPDSDKIHISLKAKGDKAVISVNDFGIGIPIEHQKSIFERFHQADTTQKNAGLNLGLGLYISKEIINKAGGEIWFESEPGKGSTFYFSLPVVD
jgi:signal transduction histidine kinase